MAAPPTVCAACLSTSLSLVGGALVCDVCGTRSAAFIEETTEFVAGVTDVARRTRVRPAVPATAAAAAAAAAAATAAAARPPAADLVLACLTCMQRVLQAQATALTTRLAAAPPALLPLTRRLWHAHLAHAGLLDTTGLGARLDAAAAGGVRSGSAAAAADAAGRAAAAAARVVAPTAGPRALLAVLALAAWVTAAPLTPADLVRWAARGELPWWDLSAFAPRPRPPNDAAAAAPPLPRALLRPAGLPSPASVAAAAARLGARLGVGSDTPLTPAPILRRWLFELGAPAALLPVASEVYATARAGGVPAAAGALSSDARRYPFLGPAAALAVAIKMGYGLGLPGVGSSPPPLPGLPPPPPDWHAWAAGVVAGSAPAPLGTPPTPADAAELGPADAAAYLAWLGEAVFPPESAGGAGGGGGRGAGGGAAARWDVGTALAQAVAAAAAAAGAAASSGRRAPSDDGDAASPAPPQKKRARGVGGGSATASPLSWPYAAPSHRDRDTSALPPDFAAVVTALAAHAWVRPDALLAAVAGVEAALLAAEARMRAG